jgi:hypothetical protein
MVFKKNLAGRAVKTILAPKFGDPTQRWDRAGLGKGGAGWNPRPWQVGHPIKPRACPYSQDRWRLSLGLPPQGQGGKRGKGGRGEGRGGLRGREGGGP